MMVGIFALFIIPLLAVVLLGWVLPLVIGLVRRHEGRGGQTLVWVGASWGLLAAALVVLAVCFTTRAVRSASRASSVTRFDAASYTGATAALVLPLTDPCTLHLHATGDDGEMQRWEIEGSNGVLQVPAGAVTLDWLNLQVPGSNGLPAAFAWVSIDAPRDRLQLAPGSRTAFEAGPPFTARVEVAADLQSPGKVSLDLRLADRAGHRASVQSLGSGRGEKPSFEAVSPDGDVFWRGPFEYG